jgi:membrane-associated protein
VPIDLEQLILAVGYAGLFAIVFAETGLFFGFFLPGDSLLLTAGLLAERGHFAIAVLIPLLFIAAVAGDATGYVIGRRTGPRLFAREDARFFKRDHLERARHFYNRHGGKTIVIARFLAIIRTFAPSVAGAVGMPYRTFTFYNVFGGALWVASMILLGYFLGTAVPNLDAVFLLVLALVVVISLLPAALHLRRSRRRSV